MPPQEHACCAPTPNTLGKPAPAPSPSPASPVRSCAPAESSGLSGGTWSSARRALARPTSLRPAWLTTP
eukprot:10271039-Alexandrium_andersonii.AAC.1